MHNSYDINEMENYVIMNTLQNSYIVHIWTIDQVLFFLKMDPCKLNVPSTFELLYGLVITSWCRLLQVSDNTDLS